MTIYSVKEIYYTLQGEGHHTGRPAVFCRFAGCNLWTGREVDRPKAICQFCDTDFWGTDGMNGGKYSALALAEKVEEIWKENTKSPGTPYVICTGGEPLLQLDDALIENFHAKKLEIGVETNGTIVPPKGIDWLCVSPKAGAELVVSGGDELKLVYPQAGAEPFFYEKLNFSHFYLQPMDGLSVQKNTKKTLKYCLEHPKWHLSLQTHKLLNIP